MAAKKKVVRKCRVCGKDEWWAREQCGACNRKSARLIKAGDTTDAELVAKGARSKHRETPVVEFLRRRA